MKKIIVCGVFVWGFIFASLSAMKKDKISKFNATKIFLDLKIKPDYYDRLNDWSLGFRGGYLFFDKSVKYNETVRAFKENDFFKDMDSKVALRAEYAARLLITKPLGKEAFTEAIADFGLHHLGKTFKLHLQVKKEVLVDFVLDFIQELNSNQVLQNIAEFKITNFYYEEFHCTSDNPFPIIVIPLPLICLPDEKLRHEFLAAFINPILDWIDKWCARKNTSLQDVALNFAPRFSKKINDICYIAGGNSDDKLSFLRLNSKHKVFSDDFCFVAGFEY